MKKLNFILVGKDKFTVQAAQLLMELGHEIRGVVTTSPILLKWAESKSIPVYHEYDFQVKSQRVPIDFILNLDSDSLLSSDIHQPLLKSKIPVIEHFGSKLILSEKSFHQA